MVYGLGKNNISLAATATVLPVPHHVFNVLLISHTVLLKVYEADALV